MPLYQSTEGGEPFVKYNTKAGRWFIRKDGADLEVVNPVFVADFKHIRKAWMNFQEGTAPDVVYFPANDAPFPKPSPSHKLGLSLRLFSRASFNGVVKLEVTASAACKALSDLYDLYEADPQAKAGMLPVVRVTGATPVKMGNYTNYAPQFVIDKWTPRPPELEDVAGTSAVVPTAPAPVAPAGDEF
jgi:hypothetical protein